MHAKHTQDTPSNIWSFNNPIRMDRARLVVTNEHGQTLRPCSSKITRHRIILTFTESAIGQVLITDCMDDAW